MRERFPLCCPVLNAFIPGDRYPTPVGDVLRPFIILELPRDSAVVTLNYGFDVALL